MGLYTSTFDNKTGELNWTINFKENTLFDLDFSEGYNGFNVTANQGEIKVDINTFENGDREARGYYINDEKGTEQHLMLDVFNKWGAVKSEHTYKQHVVSDVAVSTARSIANAVMMNRYVTAGEIDKAIAETVSCHSDRFTNHTEEKLVLYPEDYQDTENHSVLDRIANIRELAEACGNEDVAKRCDELIDTLMDIRRTTGYGHFIFLMFRLHVTDYSVELSHFDMTIPECSEYIL